MSQGNKPFVGSGVLKTPVLQAACRASRIETNRVVLTRYASISCQRGGSWSLLSSEDLQIDEEEFHEPGQLYYHMFLFD